MNESEVHKLIEEKLRERKLRIIATNTISAFCKLFSLTSALWQVLAGTKEKLDTAKGAITQEVLLDMVLVIDKKLSDRELDTKEQKSFELMLEGIRAAGDVTGLRARTSDPNLRKIFDEKAARIILRDITAGGNVTGMDLTVDCELELKKKLEVETGFASVKFNPEVGKIVFGKGLKSANDDKSKSD